MFIDFFQMHTEPFREQIPVNQILEDDRFTSGIAKLQYFLEQGIIALAIGQTGVGKSTLIKKFKAMAEQKQTQVIYVHLTSVKSSSLLSQIVNELGEIPKRGKERLFKQILQKIAKDSKTACLVVDEAHLLDEETLVDLRLLISSAMDEKPPLKILLVAQEGLKQKLKQEALADLKNRISVKIHLSRFNRSQSVAYMDHQIKLSGASEKTFDLETKEAIHDLTNGVPREINTIARACLIAAVSQNSKHINQEILNVAAEEAIF